jgi:hypothetical protein
LENNTEWTNSLQKSKDYIPWLGWLMQRTKAALIFMKVRV